MDDDAPLTSTSQQIFHGDRVQKFLTSVWHITHIQRILDTVYVPNGNAQIDVL